MERAREAEVVVASSRVALQANKEAEMEVVTPTGPAEEESSEAAFVVSVVQVKSSEFADEQVIDEVLEIAVAQLAQEELGASSERAKSAELTFGVAQIDGKDDFAYVGTHEQETDESVVMRVAFQECVRRSQSHYGKGSYHPFYFHFER